MFSGALELRKDFWNAALAPKFFMYSPGPMYMLIGVLSAYEALVRPLELVGIRDGVTFMVMGRAISATLGTATIPLVFLLARRVAGPRAGMLAAGLLAVSVIHLRDSHFFSVDVSLTFFCVLTWLAAMHIAGRARVRSYVAAGVAFGAAVLCKYSAAFLAPVIAVAHLASPRTFAWPGALQQRGALLRWVLTGIVPLVVALATFLLLDPHVYLHYDKFRADVAELVTQPMEMGANAGVWAAHFTGIAPRTYWFTNLLWWGLGPALEIWGLMGVAWLLWMRTRASLTAAAFPIFYFIAAGQTALPFIRYTVPLAPALAVAAGVLSADLLGRARWRRPALAATWIVCVTTTLWALAYMNVFVKPDVRLQASQYLLRHVQKDAHILIEPTHNTPPTGRYLTEPAFDADYMIWGPQGERHDYYRMYALDTYRHLYSRRPTDDQKREYIAQRLALADYILMDDTYVQFYDALPASEHGVVKEYYRKLFAGELGFKLQRSFKVYPSLFGVSINDDEAELTFRLFDHPRIYLFTRTTPRPQ
ncbi:MAG: glycosyltransferase family 39 protein [Vicinamibacterales bacterium]